MTRKCWPSETPGTVYGVAGTVPAEAWRLVQKRGERWVLADGAHTAGKVCFCEHGGAGGAGPSFPVASFTSVHSPGGQPSAARD